MLKIIFRCLTICSLLFSNLAMSQVGIGTTIPDSSAVLDLVSTDKGLLLPRMTTAQRDLINLPATGLMIYNTLANDVQVNTGTSIAPVWLVTEGQQDTSIVSVTASVEDSTSSTTFVAIAGMNLSPPSGSYLVLFNGQFEQAAIEPVSTAQGVIDLEAAYTMLMAFPATVTDHAPVIGNGETLAPGVYTFPAAASLAGTLTLDGQGDINALFIFRPGGAMTTGAMTMVVLINGASANNIFWISEGALSLAASTTMKGTLIAHNAAISAAAGADLEGRMFSTTGAVAFGPGTAYIPGGVSYVDLGVLSTFVMFTSLGAVGNTDPSTITGDVGSNGGAISGFENLDGNVYSPDAPPPPPQYSIVTFSVFQNGILVPFSSRTIASSNSVISLQATTSVNGGQPIEIRWHVDEGAVILNNRIMSLLNMQ
jgi:hypothetical protein